MAPRLDLARRRLYGAALLVVVLVVATTVIDCRGKARCRDAGGRVEEYDCGPVTICNDGICTTTEQCSWRCVDLPAERGPR